MNNKQIQEIMNHFISSPQQFRGVFAADTLPAIEKNCGYICNTDTINLPGKHWISFYVPKKGPIEFFDSYGFIPYIYNFYDFIGEHYFIYNNVQLQSLFSNVCGQYCIFYLLARFSGIPYIDFLNIFDNHNNDYYVNEFINDMFDTTMKVYDYDFIGKQISTMFEPNNMF